MDRTHFIYSHPYIYIIWMWVKVIISYIIMLCVTPAILIVYAGTVVVKFIDADSPHIMERTKIILTVSKEKNR